MKQEDKELLIRDLCARLPYGVKINIIEEDYLSNIYANYDDILTSIDIDNCMVNDLYDIEEVKPYLYPMSAMTQQEELSNVDEHGNVYFKVPKGYDKANVQIDIKDMSKYIDWLNKHHFDYRGLIEKGLAIDATFNIFRSTHPSYCS